MNLLLIAASTGAAGLYGASLYHYHAYAQTGHSAATVSEVFPPLCRFSDAGNDEALHTLMRPASEKRQGTKSRRVGHPAVPLALWGFGRGVRAGEF